MRWTPRVLAAVLAILLAVLASDLVVPSICASLTPDNWFLWFWHGCGKDSSGGGGSGAGLFLLLNWRAFLRREIGPHRPQIVDAIQALDPVVHSALGQAMKPIRPVRYPVKVITLAWWRAEYDSSRKVS